MRFSLVVLGLVAAVSATTADANVDVNLNAKVDAEVKTNAEAAVGKDAGCDDTTTAPGTDADISVHVNGNADADINGKTDATVNADIHGSIHGSAHSKAHLNVNGNVNMNSSVNSTVDPSVNADINVNVDASIQAEINAAIKGFTCPNTMAYCAWTKSCSCEPGQSWSRNVKACVGMSLTGDAWPEPQVDIFGSVNVNLAKFCAISPTKICEYDAAHDYCQASLDSITFVADAKISPEIKRLGVADINLNSGSISPELKSVCAGLQGLYLEHVEDAIALFNTKVYGFNVIEANLTAAVKLGSVTTTQHTLCRLGLGSCQRDCVAFPQQGCANFINADSVIGNQIQSLNGLCILPSVILSVTKAKQIVSVAVEHLLCIVGSAIKTVLSTFDCHCK
ncbi:hypothetical protein NQ176_g1850 [Zarea fungicola]|uniref:Uncharacterized protein n=1 Tax=Zarea fungicola TaxID=93591 RepID=A0ACC1NR18_9HYPO|nr:hypothetical protein NQ176_g1850 [Lecanicillium fungicola]